MRVGGVISSEALIVAVTLLVGLENPSLAISSPLLSNVLICAKVSVGCVGLMM
jgi:hypothetical protein